jgi:tetratricopeptide (TPR) repeat protein
MGMVLLAHDIRPQAAECFTRASALNKREPRWPYFLGLAQVADNPAAAAINFARAVRLFPERELAPRLALADTLLGLGHSTEAEKHYRAVLELEPGCARAKLGMGKLANSRVRPLRQPGSWRSYTGSVQPENGPAPSRDPSPAPGPDQRG